MRLAIVNDIVRLEMANDIVWSVIYYKPETHHFQKQDYNFKKNMSKKHSPPNNYDITKYQTM